jgi:hypothetical protein
MVFFCTSFHPFFSLQAQDDPYDITNYAFVNYKVNQFEIYDLVSYDVLFAKLTQIGLQGEGKVRIVHIGDSHLQADFFSGNFRRKLQTFFLGAVGGRGFIFPYKVAQTNNPLNYKVKSQGHWENCRNIEKNKRCKLGLSGIVVSTSEINATVSVSIDDPNLKGYDFDKLMVFHEFGNKKYVPRIENSISTTPFPKKGYTLFEFETNISAVTLKLERTDSIQKSFDFYGFNFESNDPGIIYHTIGVNGAKFDSYLGCEYFTPHLAALEPDLVIISLGTNDVYTYVFDTLDFKNKVDSLIGNVKKAAPMAAILLTTPSDHRIKKGEVNRNVAQASAILKSKAKQWNISYWDYYTVMGGQGSIDFWRSTGMAHTDYLHYTQKGYEYQSQLMFNAFLNSYDDYLAKEILK